MQLRGCPHQQATVVQIQQISPDRVCCLPPALNLSALLERRRHSPMFPSYFTDRGLSLFSNEGLACFLCSCDTQ